MIKKIYDTGMRRTVYNTHRTMSPTSYSNMVFQDSVLQNDRTSAKADRVCYIVVLLRMKPGIYYYLDACRMNCFTPSAALPTFQ